MRHVTEIRPLATVVSAVVLSRSRCSAPAARASSRAASVEPRPAPRGRLREAADLGAPGDQEDRLGRELRPGCDRLLARGGRRDGGRKGDRLEHEALRREVRHERRVGHVLPPGDRGARGRHRRDRDRLRGGQAATAGGEARRASRRSARTTSTATTRTRAAARRSSRPTSSTRRSSRRRRPTGRRSASGEATYFIAKTGGKAKIIELVFPEVDLHAVPGQGAPGGLAVLQRLPDRRPAQSLGAGSGDEPGAAEVLGGPAEAPGGKRRGRAVRHPLRVRAAAGAHLLGPRRRS